MDIINLGVSDGLPPVDWITAPFNAPSQGPPPWHVFRIRPTSATVVLGTEPGGLTRFRF